MALSGFDDDTRRICLCDSEFSYGEHLMEYLRRRAAFPGGYLPLHRQRDLF